jgi:hypothetical protein
MSLNMISSLGLPGNVFIKAPVIHLKLASGARQLEEDVPGVYKYISWKSKTDNAVYGNIYIYILSLMGAILIYPQSHDKSARLMWTISEPFPNVPGGGGALIR